MPQHCAAHPARLNTRELLHIQDGEGSKVACVEGSVWITQSNDARDITLDAGETFVLDRPGLALVCAAAGPAVVVVEAARVLRQPARSVRRGAVCTGSAA